MWSSVPLSGTTPSVESSPNAGFRPTSPQTAEGIRIDPPVSVPIDAKHIPSATDAAEPPDDPPGDRFGSWGCRAGPKAESSFVVPKANSWRFVLPTTIAPAPRSAATDGASASATWCSRTREAAVVAVPRTSNRSFREIGTPCSGPRRRPAAISRSASRACSRASLPNTLMNALSVALRSAMRWRHRSTTASAVVSRAWSARDRSAMVCGSAATAGIRTQRRVTGRVGVPLRRPQRRRRLRERLEQRLELGKAPPLRVVRCHFEPRFHRHARTAYSDRRVRHTKIIATVDLAKAVSAGNALLLDDGHIQLRVESVSGNELRTTVVDGGVLGEHKGINVPGVVLPANALTPKDVDDLTFGARMGVDYVALSFVQTAEDLRQARAALVKAGTPRTPLAAKLERPEPVGCRWPYGSRPPVRSCCRGPASPSAKRP